MPDCYERFLKPWLFRMDAEKAHRGICALAELSGHVPFVPALVGRIFRAEGEADMGSHLLGLNFKNPIGLAAGFDKDCRMLKILPALGFGFIEVGSATLKPQPGNPRPRLFRLPEFEALINRMGFNSAGAWKCAERLNRAGRVGVPLGINLGLNADAPAQEAPELYAATFRILEPYGDYFVVNVSSPNTAGLRGLQERRRLENILARIEADNKNRKPVLIKISPDLDDRAVEAVAAVALKSAAGVVAANTTTSRAGLPSDLPEIRGGLSGAPLRSRSSEIIARIYAMSRGKIPIIGVGGVFSGADAFEKIRSGASLVQVYTALVYRGPGVVRAIVEELAALLEVHGFKDAPSAVGTGVSS